MGYEENTKKSLWKPCSIKKQIKAFQCYNPVQYERGVRERETGILDPDYDTHFVDEEYIMYIFPTGYRDIYHVIIESAFEDSEYFMMQAVEIYMRYSITEYMLTE